VKVSSPVFATLLGGPAMPALATEWVDFSSVGAGAGAAAGFKFLVVAGTLRLPGCGAWAVSCEGP
jgi:hypothetical protein